ncbi:carboxymuconolactone decarboxylase family protein [Botrimarina mediterranea]|uniref:Carboxymuconolactone decarboxylase family protein n=1 Tax=Botrimarina mediterranea TaxID=2528022 RepID=A0A518K3D6_9BACT|nr:carboxymuconolactone decarboxylase family protein [Botrimarina mediterranea]QDV72313.1 Carboxymuconolactone decarboxylase family protein [Botrimarina mediterranea]QDV76857.1 Carboxymuconolactone decarboxylase family protein [Planctomycetes bacterium K2D]
MSATTTTAPAPSDAYRGMLSLERAIGKGRIELSLRELIKQRVSQINGCAFCIDMHWKDARAAGETEQRLYSLPAWRECPYYSERERAGLLLAEELTRLADKPAPEAAIERAHEHFDAQELEDLLWVIAAINTWNRISIGSRKTPGDYQPEGATH